jgi:thermitase
LLLRLSGVALCVLLLLGISSGMSAQSPERVVDKVPEGAPYAAGELLITHKSGVPQRSLDAVSQGVGAQVEEKIPEIEARLLSFPEVKNERARQARQDALKRIKERLEANPIIESADYNYLRKPSFNPNDPRFEKQWNLKRVRAPKAWDKSSGNGVKIGVIDSGIAQNHSDLSNKIADQRDFVNGDGRAKDNDGHGTHVAGIAAAITDNDRGVASTCPGCRLLVAKALTSGGFDSDIADGIVWAVNHGAKVVNLSLGGPGGSSALGEAVSYASNNGAVVAAAAGNSDTNTKTYPAAYKNAVAVAATNKNDKRAPFSNYGNWVDVAAPGVKILSTVPGGGYALYSGTSMSTPHVSGLAGLLAAKGLNNSQVRARIENNARDLGPNGEDPYYGEGRIDAARAVYKPYRWVADNQFSSRFRASGAWAGSSANPERHLKHYRITRSAGDSDTAKFKVRTPITGNYDVFGWWPSNGNYNNRTRFLIQTINGWETRGVNQRKNGGRWFYLGNYPMKAGVRWSVRIPRRSSGSGFVAADAIMVRLR